VFRYERWIDEPRLFCWQSGSGRHPALVETQAWISRRYRSLFDGVAVTLYRDEHDGVGFHRDRELRWLEGHDHRRARWAPSGSWLDAAPDRPQGGLGRLTGVIDLAPATGDLLVMAAAARPRGCTPSRRPGAGSAAAVGPVAVDVPAGPA
jgi:hypothetical protein